MDDMVTMTLNGAEVKAQNGTPILSVARRMNVYIPTLCNNEALVPYGVCRMCLVEIEKGGRQRVVTSCNYPAEEGLLVKTDTERVVKTRNVVMELLLARAPENKTIVDLASRLGVKGGRLSPGQRRLHPLWHVRAHLRRSGGRERPGVCLPGDDPDADDPV